MTAEINALFEEGITRCRELSDEADEAVNAIDEMAKGAEGLTRRLEQEGKEACRRLRDLTRRFEQAEAELESSGTRVDGALGALDAAADRLQEGAHDLVARVEATLAALSSRTEEIDRSLDAQMAEVHQGFEDLARKTSDAGAEMKQQAGDAVNAISHLGRVVDDSRRELAQQLEEWSAAGQTLATASQEAAGEWAAGLSALLERLATALVESTNAVVDQHNEAMSGLELRFVERAPAEVVEALGAPLSGLSDMGTQALELAKRVKPQAEAQEGWADRATTTVEAIGTALAGVARLD